MALAKLTSRPRNSFSFHLMIPLLLFTFTILTHPAAAFTQALCSSENTASGSGQSYQFNSNGHCSTQCAGYAFAVVQNLECWCSNYAPADTVSVGSCSQNCPGYPFEQCGNSDSGLFGYVALGPSPSGTLGGSSTQSPSTSSDSTDTTATAAASTSADTSTSTTSHSTTSWTPVVSTQIITQSGSAMTLTVTNTPTGEALSSSKKKSSTSGGLIAGVVVACIVALVALGAAIFWWLRHRYQRRHTLIGADGRVINTGSGFGSPQRPMSVSTGSALMGNAISAAPPRLNLPSDTDDNSPVSLADRRGSQGLFPYHQQDSRLQPFSHPSWNESRGSFNDGADYTRRLQVANPDPESQSIAESTR